MNAICKAVLRTVLCVALAVLCVGAGPRVRRGCQVAWDPVLWRLDGITETPTGYHIYTSTTSGSYGAPTLTVTNATTQVSCRTLGTVTHNQQYYAQITAYNAQGESAPTAEIAWVTTRGVVVFRH